MKPAGISRTSAQEATCKQDLQVQAEVGRVLSLCSSQCSRWDRKHVDSPSQAVIADFATTASEPTVAKSATVGKLNSVVKKSFTTDVGVNRQG